MKSQIPNGVFVGMVQSVDGMGRSSSVPSIHDDTQMEGNESWVKHMG
jgi:hypothetical protein